MKQKEEPGVSEVQEDRIYKFCLRCGRPLKSETAKKIGMGKVCLEKSKTDHFRYAKLF